MFTDFNTDTLPRTSLSDVLMSWPWYLKCFGNKNVNQCFRTGVNFLFLHIVAIPSPNKTCKKRKKSKKDLKDKSNIDPKEKITQRKDLSPWQEWRGK